MMVIEADLVETGPTTEPLTYEEGRLLGGVLGFIFGAAFFGPLGAIAASAVLFFAIPR